MQRGTVKGIGIGEGDPLTLGYPATGRHLLIHFTTIHVLLYNAFCNVGSACNYILGYVLFVDEAFRRDASLADEIPKIPIQPIGYADALEFLRFLLLTH